MTQSSTIKIAKLLPTHLKDLLESSGAEFIKRAGEKQVRQVVIDILCGNNLRASTEHLTRLRLGKINAATFLVYLAGLEGAKDFTRQIPNMALETFKGKSGGLEKQLCTWMVGLTGKGIQNILRDDRNQLGHYLHLFAANLKTLAQEACQTAGQLTCSVKLSSGNEVTLDWHDLLSLFCTIGSQTLAIRGSEKSTYGKLFERLVLGSVLAALGFEQTGVPPTKTSNVFWLSSKLGEREADATVLIGPGQAIRFDLGFIGRGNPEITKDKVSRFEREIEIGMNACNSSTCIIVDCIGEGSALKQQADRIGAKVIQMSMSYWPKELAHWLHSKFNYKSDISAKEESELRKLFEEKLATISFHDFVQGLSVSAAEVEEE